MLGDNFDIFNEYDGSHNMYDVHGNPHDEYGHTDHIQGVPNTPEEAINMGIGRDVENDIKDYLHEHTDAPELLVDILGGVGGGLTEFGLNQLSQSLRERNKKPSKPIQTFTQGPRLVLAGSPQNNMPSLLQKNTLGSVKIIKPTPAKTFLIKPRMLANSQAGSITQQILKSQSNIRFLNNALTYPLVRNNPYRMQQILNLRKMHVQHILKLGRSFR